MRRPRPLIPTPDIAPPPKGSRTFALDAQDAQRRLNNINDPEAVRDSIVSHGLYERAFFTWADVRAIAPEKVWKPERLQRALEAIEAGIPLPALDVVPGDQTNSKDRLLHLNDGIHRYNAALHDRLTHVPVIVRRWRSARR